MAEEDYCKCGKKLIANLEIALRMCYSCQEDRTTEVFDSWVQESQEVKPENRLCQAVTREELKPTARHSMSSHLTPPAMIQ
jgi:hypothetical protein